MGENLEIIALIEARNEIFEEILSNMRTWDSNIESGISLIESNQVSLDNLKTLNSEIYKINATSIYDEEYSYKLNLISKELEKLTNALRGKQSNLLDGKQQLNKKNQVINSYLSVNKESIFIDKDVL